MTEPRLTPEDRRIWDAWRRQALTHARTRRHLGRVESARREIERMAERRPDAYVAWSAGKDSTALVHLVRVECAVPGRVMAVKDDLDFPGEEEYLRELADAWGVDLDILRPPFSLQAWLAEHAADIEADEDLHSRSAAFSKAAFYAVVRAYRESMGAPGVYLGLRAEESRGRALNRYQRGRTYQKADGEVVCQPLADWTGIDVYAYLLSRGIDLLPMYRCVRLHERPDRVRKSWWLPGASTRHGGMVWLRAYYPSLYRRLCELLPDAGRHA